MGPLFLTNFAGKWLGLVTAIWVQAICGNNYTFANYSDALKSLMALTQLQLNNLSVAKDVGKAFGLLPGFASDCMTPSVLLIIRSLEGFIGYGVQWLVVSQRIRPLPYWQVKKLKLTFKLAKLYYCALAVFEITLLWIVFAIADVYIPVCGRRQHNMDEHSSTSNFVRNFPKNRSPVSGILKDYVGLSTAIFTDICTALFSSDPSTFLFILAAVPAIVCLTAVFFLHETPPVSKPSELEQEPKYFNIFSAIAIILAVYLFAIDITGSHGQILSLILAPGLGFIISNQNKKYLGQDL